MFTDHVTMVSEEICSFRFAALSCVERSREERNQGKPLGIGYDHVRVSEKPKKRR